MKVFLGLSLMVAVLFSLGLRQDASAQTKPVEVTVTNYTTGQPFGPVSCVVHDPEFSLYELGEAANTAVESIAEDAVTSDLQALVDADPAAKQLVVGGGPIGPGHTGTVVVDMRKKELVTCLWMLVNTNDTFASITDVARPKKKNPVHLQRIALDAGTEVNDQLAANIPGPCCGDTGRNGVPENGVVLGSTGIEAGTGDLSNAHDWRGPVAAVTVKRQ